METNYKPTQKNLSAVKALDIIEFLADGDNAPRRLQDIARGLSMNASTVLRFLTALADCGYVVQDPASLHYSLTLKICAVANKVSSNIHIHDVALPIMKQVAAKFNESVCLAIEQDMTVVYIAVVQGPGQMLQTMQRIGNRAPMHCTGVGKLLLLNHNADEIDEMIRQKGLPVFTKNTIDTKQALMRQLDSTRALGYGTDNEECEIGARCIAVPIRDYTRRIVAGMRGTGPIFRLTDEAISQNLPFLMEQAELMSQQLGFQRGRIPKAAAIDF